MSDYGRADGPYPGGPSDPWGREDADPIHPGSPYGPSEQYGRPPAQYHPDQYQRPEQPSPHPGSPPGGYRQPGGYPDADPRQPAGTPWRPDAERRQPEADPRQPAGGPWQPPVAAPAKKSSTGLIITLVAVLVVVLCGGGGLALYLLNAKGSPPAKQPAAGSTAGSASASVAASPTYDPSAISKGQCVVNDGTGDAPRLRVVNCGPGSYLVVARFNGTAETEKCSDVAGSTHDYYYETTPSTLDFVLCLKQQ